MSPVQTVTHVSGMDPSKMVGARGLEPPTARTPLGWGTDEGGGNP